MRKIKDFILPLSIMASSLAMSINAFALNIEDFGENGGGAIGEIAGQTVAPVDQGMVDILKQSGGISSDQLSQAQAWASPIVNVFGNIVGVLLILTIAFVMVTTVLDLVCISAPPLRNILGFYGQGAFGIRWVSDECINAINMGNGASAGAQMQRPGMGPGMGMGMGGMGGPGMGGPGMMGNRFGGMGGMSGPGMMGGMGSMGGPGMMGAQQQQKPRTGSVISIYFKKRIAFIIIFLICSVVLLSSTVMGFGLNLAQWILRIISFLTGKLE